MELTLVRAGRMAYGEAFELQQRLVGAVKAEPDERAYLVLVEHPPVLTVGRSGDETDFVAGRELLEREGIEVHEVNRGGRTTYHGPGQLVGYPIIALRGERRDVHRYLRSIEAVIIDALKQWGVDGFRREGLTGVWTQQGKIAAIGVGVSRWVTFHGFALNVDPIMAHFGLIHPCGLRGVAIATMAGMLGRAIAIDEVAPDVVERFRIEFGFDSITECGSGECPGS